MYLYLYDPIMLRLEYLQYLVVLVYYAYNIFSLNELFQIITSFLSSPFTTDVILFFFQNNPRRPYYWMGLYLRRVSACQKLIYSVRLLVQCHFLYPNIFHQLFKSPGILCYAKHCREWIFRIVTNEVACLYLKLQFLIKKKWTYVCLFHLFVINAS